MLKTYYSVNDNILLDAEKERSIAVASVVCMAHARRSTNVYPEKCLNLCYASTFSPVGFFEAKGICTCEFLSRIFLYSTGEWLDLPSQLLVYLLDAVGLCDK